MNRLLKTLLKIYLPIWWGIVGNCVLLKRFINL